MNSFVEIILIPVPGDGTGQTRSTSNTTSTITVGDQRDFFTHFTGQNGTEAPFYIYYGSLAKREFCCFIKLLVPFNLTKKMKKKYQKTEKC